MNLSDDALKGDGDPVIDAVLLASRALVAVAARSLADVGEEVTLAQYRTLVVLASQGPQSLAGLADAVGVTPATATRMCDRLVKKKLVVRKTELEDRRQVRVAMTVRGRKLVRSVSERRRHEIRNILADIPRAEQDSLVLALRRFTSAAGEVPDQDWSTGWDL
jgi:DNA-binding MarR family transcriptional regulator